MKKVYFFACLILCLQGASSNASAADESTAIQARATTLTRAIANKARLDEGQYLKVKQLNVKMLSDMDALKVRYAADPLSLDQKMAEVQIEYDVALARVMRSNQFAMYQQSRSSMTALMNAAD
ncbi:hypothetical protein GCM10011375_16310 [Hymenobacter qilianensis]|uniref:Uncharacterized protein n=2 Tax=Hymenobacter qilianensis TaxID=1385715 RepID=A0ACB5PQJ1_9BACT|nr:hypothetical protein [Hymenobacter qilianensis]QNP51839.1 hypothetical protein H9L05_18125 [Hymenobacter qilianensis]GGF62061.1 hypothetical protein GCM10011375_16310 [Hymenobacter qilianensis]